MTLGIAEDIDYYKTYGRKFLEQADGKWDLFVFSDDMAWCKAHQKELGFDYFMSITNVEGNVQGKNYTDMQLMSKCRGMIMSNSAFCYLASLLNTDLQYCMNPTSREVF